jgi:microcystin-dependent protein
MKGLAVVFAVLLTIIGVARAMDQADVPTKFPIPWGNSAGSSYIRVIPQASQIGIQNCAASLTDGFPPLTFVPSTAGGCPPFGQDFNGVLRQVSSWSRWQAAGAFPIYDASFSSSIGGYPSGATLANASTPGCFWVSSVDANSSNPDSSGANWASSCPGGGVGGNSSGTANAQIVAATPFVLTAGAVVSFRATLSNTSVLRVNVNGTGLIDVYRRSQLGAALSVGGEVVNGSLVQLQYDGARWQCMSCLIVQVGEIRDYAGSTAPDGWFFPDGTCISQTTYAELFQVIGTQYGSCSAGLFALPDLRGRVIAGRDDLGGSAASRLTSATMTPNGTTLGATGGGQQSTLITANLPAYTPAGSVGSNTTGITATTTAIRSPAPTGTIDFSPGSLQQLTATVAIIDPGHLHSFTGTAQGGTSTAFTHVPPAMVANKIIKF